MSWILVEAGLGGATRPRLTAITPLAGEHGGLGALRVGTTAALAFAGGRLPALPDLAEPIRPLDFVTPGHREASPARAAMIHALARGGSHVAIVLRPAGAREATA